MKHKQIRLSGDAHIELSELKLEHERRGTGVSLSALAERLLKRAMAAEKKRLAS